MATDAALLQTYARNGDAEAFRQLVERHAGMVYGTALRITANPHDAEDVAQECFLQLARNAAKAARAVPAWLHRTARNRALNLVRERATRARYEPRAASRTRVAEPTWQEIALHVDAALDALSDDLRHPLVAHFLEGRTQAEIADDLGVNQSTVSRRMEKGLSLLRGQLSDAGLTVPAAVLGATLAQNAVHAAPPAVVSALGKLGLGGPGAQAAAAAGAAGVGTAKLAAAVGGTALAVGLAVFTLARQPGPPPQAAPVATVHPAPVGKPHITEGGRTEMRRTGSVPELTRRPGLQCSFIGALEAVLKAHGEAYDYVDLMGLSGAAFRIRLARSSWREIMGGRIHPAVSTDGSFGPHADALMAATGYQYQIAGRMGEGAAGGERLATIIRWEINAGNPLLALNMHNGTSWGVVCGYDDVSPATADGDARPAWVLSRSTYDEPGADPIAPPVFPTDIWSIARAGEPPARVESVRASLRLAVELLATEKAEVQHPGGWIWHYEPEYANGLAAYDAWIADLEDEPGIAALPPDQRLMYWQGNAVMYAQLLDARDAAASYLERVAPTLTPGEREPLETAATIYRRMVAEMVTAWAAVPFQKGGYTHENGWLLREHREEFLGESVPPYSESWTPEMRKRTIDALKAARGRDEEALGLLQQAVDAQPAP